MTPEYIADYIIQPANIRLLDCPEDFATASRIFHYLEEICLQKSLGNNYLDIDNKYAETTEDIKILQLLRFDVLECTDEENLICWTINF